jgi:hypothetical protein
MGFHAGCCAVTSTEVMTQEKADAMIAHLASLAEKRLILSFAPYTPYYAVLKRIGELFPGPSKVLALPVSVFKSEKLAPSNISQLQHGRSVVLDHA